MKLSGGVLLTSVASHAAVAAASNGHVFIYDPVRNAAAPDQAPSLSPDTARLILAQRLGVSQYHSIGDTAGDDEIIPHLNAYGGIQELFTDDHTQDKSFAHALVWVEGVDDVEVIIRDRSAYSGAFSVLNPPDASANERLLRDLVDQVETLPKKPDPSSLTSLARVKTRVAFSNVKDVHTYNDYLTVIRADASDGETLSRVARELESLLQNPSKSASALTVVIMPSTSSRGKRSANSYGSYRLAPREARREPTEALLSFSASTPSSGPQMLASEDVASAQQEDESPVLGIIPRYYETNATCQKKTRNCSGHGWCTELRKDSFGCTCVPTIVHVGENGMEEKRQVTYWGGPACQKKDVSQPFWLFAGSGIVLAFLISASIGLLYSMGNEELPSVIGAGVSGPVKK